MVQPSLVWVSDGERPGSSNAAWFATLEGSSVIQINLIINWFKIEPSLAIIKKGILGHSFDPPKLFW